MQVVAACKFNECCNYHFLLVDIPVAGIPVNIRIIRQGEFCHKCELVIKRHMIGDTRAIINEQLKKTTINDYQMTQYTSMSKNYEIGGNLTLPQPKDALRKNQLNLATDSTQETKILMDIFRTIIPGGFIQNFSYNPYKVHLYTIDQLEMFRASQQKVLYFDATSSLVRNIGNQKNIFLYSIVMKSPLEKTPVAEMLSTSQCSSEIKHFLMKITDFSQRT